MYNLVCYNSAINLVSSFAFGVAAYYSLYIRNSICFMQGSMMCLISSILYHGARTLKLDEDLINSLRTLDIINIHVCTIYFTILSFGYNIWYLLWWLCIIYMVILYYWMNVSYHPSYGYYLHSSYHLLGGVGISFMLESYILMN
jgi:hypothetical protein